mmetsp:Transcript_8055/g.19837  ORF Transcript_8055/g.19837 Transcript_8055/m.19837 type:complete len:264 (-) Transcript_8055:942-1733(-)
MPCHSRNRLQTVRPIVRRPVFQAAQAPLVGRRCPVPPPHEVRHLPLHPSPSVKAGSQMPGLPQQASAEQRAFPASTTISETGKEAEAGARRKRKAAGWLASRRHPRTRASQGATRFLPPRATIQGRFEGPPQGPPGPAARGGGERATWPARHWRLAISDPTRRPARVWRLAAIPDRNTRRPANPSPRGTGGFLRAHLGGGSLPYRPHRHGEHSPSQPIWGRQLHGSPWSLSRRDGRHDGEFAGQPFLRGSGVPHRRRCAAAHA